MDNWLKNNTVLKIISVLLAIMLWMVVSLDKNANNIELKEGNQQNTYYYNAKVSTIFDENQYVVNIPNNQINVSIRGREDIIEKIHEGEYIDESKFLVDLSQYSSGAYMVPITYTGFPEGVEININPKEIKVEIQSKFREEMDVTIDKLGQEAEGYKSGDAIVRPKKVHVSGTKEQIEQIAFVKAFVNIEGATKPILQQVPLRALDKHGNVVDIEITPQIVEVQIPVTSPFVTIPLTYDIEKYPMDGLAIKSLTQLTKEVTIYGPKEEIDRYNVYIGPSLDLSELTEDRILKLEIPLNKGLLKTEPAVAQFDVEIAEAKEQVFSEVPIDLNGLSDNLIAEVITPENGVSVTLEGSEEILNTISNEDIQVFVDLTNLPPGTHDVQVEYNVPLFTKKVGDHETITVLIKKG